jgi:hypothetical protein
MARLLTLGIVGPREQDPTPQNVVLADRARSGMENTWVTARYILLPGERVATGKHASGPWIVVLPDGSRAVALADPGNKTGRDDARRPSHAETARVC